MVIPDAIPKKSKPTNRWSTTVEFTVSTENLIKFVENTIEEVFRTVLQAGAVRFLDNIALSLEPGSPQKQELEYASKELRQRGVSLTKILEASLEFVIGRTADNCQEEARQHYEYSWRIFQEISSNSVDDLLFVRQGCLCYCL
ncbi:MAG: hypothetical protein F6K24_54835, partial [Okeania sp. SIO2D1]|nr:hypothetical protein [Okeania sp. SIO2D1]